MLIWLAVLTFVLFSGLAAARLFLLWHESRQLPELLIAILIFGVGTIAVGGGFLIAQLISPGPILEVARFLPTLGAGIGMIALCIFTWRVYRIGSTIAQCVAGFFTLGITTIFAIAIFSGTIDTLSRSPFQELNYLMYVGVMLWSSSEAFVYWIPMRRRLRLGIADAVVVNRVLLWGLATGTAGIGIAIGAVGTIIGAPGEPAPLWVSANFAVFGMVSAIGFWLAFKPPSGYARWIERRGAEVLQS
jgi:hypothetical protein